ncbi:MAG: hypothetical protein JEZ00_09325 [Anaerolineaceae bacterium]|nr:hypothetical protein [Anaerolineaceae bacterium]
MFFQADHLNSTRDQTYDDSAYVQKVSVREKRNSPYEIVAWLPSSPNHIGGLPGWVQFPEYPTYPRCQERMKFLAQADVGNVTYAFICQDCNIAAIKCQAE